MMINGKNLNLKQYMELENKVDKNSDYYNETFCNIVYDYMSHCDLLEDDIKFLGDNDYTIDDFMDDDENIINESVKAVQKHIEGHVVNMDSFITIDDIKKEIDNMKVINKGLTIEQLELFFFKGFTKLNDEDFKMIENSLVEGFKHRIKEM